MPPAIPAPHITVPDFLPKEEHARLLAWTLENQDLFVPARVFTGVDEDRRRALVLSDIGPFKMPFAAAAAKQYKSWVAQMGLPPFDVSGVELELAAHNDGAHFHRHLDTQTVMGGDGSHRALSAVYYFYREPKRFTGGQLRIYPQGTADGSVFATVEPTQNTLAVFPSWAAHQVMRVECPSQDFADSRFAVNCWLHVRTRLKTA
ncbi:2OG-Fe(II) oxygenase [Terriglobus roseus]|uniref:2OG-Fe(II) oxygenase superfamily protein n=1 Tax=Terriglobus roseus TaxID=392734 RepID=A0A1H4P2N6_9BACT|nr:2OG-Fe(II) oxygenase [Terriglobus roseus]SEC01565.1 2OG-Fe(II) oxygenase superfamily protein [Terriglobus roseus]